MATYNATIDANPKTPGNQPDNVTQTSSNDKVIVTATAQISAADFFDGGAGTD
jgi:hypothetical protein